MTSKLELAAIEWAPYRSGTVAVTVTSAAPCRAAWRGGYEFRDKDGKRYDTETLMEDTEYNHGLIAMFNKVKEEHSKALEALNRNFEKRFEAIRSKMIFIHAKDFVRGAK